MANKQMHHLKVGDNIFEIVDSVARSGISGAPTIVSLSSAMSDTSKLYLYIGSEAGYTSGDWYYHNGTSWVSGGQYGDMQLDTSLTTSGMAADAKSVGDRFDSFASTATAGQSPIADGQGGWAWGDVQGGISTESANLLCDILAECLTGTDQTANIVNLRTMLTGGEPSPDPPVTIAYIVTNNLTNVSSSNSATSVNSGASYSATLTGDSGYLLTDATVTMGGVDITTSAVSSTGRNTLNISIASVTGAVVITATAEAEEPAVTEVTMASKGASYNCAVYSDDGQTALLSAKSSTTYVSDETFAEDTQVTITITYGANENTNLKQWAASTLDTNDNKHGYYGVEIGHAQQAPYTATYTVKAGHKLMIKNYNSGSWQSMTVTK